MRLIAINRELTHDNHAINFFNRLTALLKTFLKRVYKVLKFESFLGLTDREIYYFILFYLSVQFHWSQQIFKKSLRLEV